MTLRILIVLVALSGCKRGPQPTLPQIPDSNQIPGGGNTDLPQAVIFHTIYRYTGHAGQAHAFFAPEMQKRGAVREGDAWVANMKHEGSFGSQGFASVEDPSQPGVWLAAEDMPNETRVDVWEAVPNPK